MTVKEYLKALKKQAKKRGIIDDEISALTSGGDYHLVKTTDENGIDSFWRFGYEQREGKIIPVIKS